MKALYDEKTELLKFFSRIKLLGEIWEQYNTKSGTKISKVIASIQKLCELRKKCGLDEEISTLILNQK